MKVDWDRNGLRTLAKAGELRVNASGLMFDGHHQPVPPDAMPRRFLLEHTCKLDKPKGKSTTSVLKGISDDLEAFYGHVVEHLAGYVAPAPKLPKEVVAAQDEHAMATAIGSERSAHQEAYAEADGSETSAVVAVVELSVAALVAEESPAKSG